MEVDQLFEDNVEQIVVMANMSGSMVKHLILELKQPGRDTRIRLFDAEPEGHTVFYEVVEGNSDLVIGLAEALMVFSEVTATKLTVLT